MKKSARAKGPLVAIDGPVGSGKSTIAKLIAKRLGFTHIDTGALYRGLALVAIERGADIAEEKSVLAATEEVVFSFKQTEAGNLLHVNGKSVAKKIRTEEVGLAASKVSAYPGVRARLLGLQRELGASGAAVLEGRDIGTVVFPDAEVKIFLTASVNERARRRYEELESKGENVSFEDVKSDLIRRDKQDSERAIAPLKKAQDAIELDTTGVTIDSVLDRLESIIRND